MSSNPTRAASGREHRPTCFPAQPGGYDARLVAVTGRWAERFAAFDVALDARHPAIAHHLAPAVQPDRQGQGTGAVLLHACHQHLDHDAGALAYLEASDLRTRQNYLRHGNADHRLPIGLPGASQDCPRRPGHALWSRMIRRIIGPPVLTRAEAAQLLGVHPSTVARWAVAGLLPCVRTPSGQRRYRSQDVEELLNKRLKGQPGPMAERAGQSARGRILDDDTTSAWRCRCYR